MSTPEGGSARPVTLRYWAAARDAAGVREEVLDVGAGAGGVGAGAGGPGTGTDLVAGVTVGDVLAEASRRHPALDPVLAVSSVLADGRVVHPGDALLAGALLEVLPPFAGG